MLTRGDSSVRPFDAVEAKHLFELRRSDIEPRRACNTPRVGSQIIEVGGAHFARGRSQRFGPLPVAADTVGRGERQPAPKVPRAASALCDSRRVGAPGI